MACRRSVSGVFMNQRPRRPAGVFARVAGNAVLTMTPSSASTDYEGGQNVAADVIGHQIDVA